MNYLSFDNVSVELEFTVDPAEDNSTGHPDTQLPSQQTFIEIHKIKINGFPLQEYIEKYYMNMEI